MSRDLREGWIIMVVDRNIITHHALGKLNLGAGRSCTSENGRILFCATTGWEHGIPVVIDDSRIWTGDGAELAIESYDLCSA